MKLTRLVKKATAALLAMTLVIGFSGVSYADTKITQSEKENYYAQYLKIAEEVSKETGRVVGVIPFEDFTENEWVTPDEFRERALELAAISVHTSENSRSIGIQSTASCTKSTTFSVDSITETLYIKGSFETQYSSYHQRQLFAGVNSITSYISSSSKGSWSQIDYDYDRLDGGRTYYVTVSGKYTRLGLYTNIYGSVYFYCSQNGAVS